MAEWTRTDPIYNLLPNLYLQGVLKDGVLQYYVIYPCEGYVLHVPSGDFIGPDPDGNEVCEPYYTWGGGTVARDYDFTTNPEGYEAVPYQDGMIVFGDVKPPHEIM